MNFRDLKEGSSLKYFYKGSKKDNLPPLEFKGVFYKIGKKSEEHLFYGYIIGSREVYRNPRTFSIFLTGSDSDVTKGMLNNYIYTEGCYNLEIRKPLYMNINNIKPTRLNKDISLYIKENVKVLKEAVKIDEELEKLERLKKQYMIKSNKIRNSELYNNAKAKISSEKMDNGKKKILTGSDLVRELDKSVNISTDGKKLGDDGIIYKFKFIDRGIAVEYPLYRQDEDMDYYEGNLEKVLKGLDRAKNFYINLDKKVKASNLLSSNTEFLVRKYSTFDAIYTIKLNLPKGSNKKEIDEFKKLNAILTSALDVANNDILKK